MNALGGAKAGGDLTMMMLVNMNDVEDGGDGGMNITTSR